MSLLRGVATRLPQRLHFLSPGRASGSSCCRRSSSSSTSRDSSEEIEATTQSVGRVLKVLAVSRLGYKGT